MDFNNYLIEHSHLYRKRHFLKNKLDRKLKTNTDLQILFGMKDSDEKSKLLKMNLSEIKKNIINKNKELYKGYTKFNKTELVNFIIGKSSERKGHFDYTLMMKNLDDDVLQLKNKKIKIYLDICAAPGDYSKYLTDTYKIKGVGVTLPTNEGGINFDYKLKDYKIEYLDIVKNSKKVIRKDKFPFIVSGCLDMRLGRKEKFNNIRLWLSTMLFGLMNLQKNGIFAFKISLKYMEFAANIIYIFTKIFKNVKTSKSLDAIGYRSVFYVIGFDYQENLEYIKLLEILLSKIKNKNYNRIVQFRNKTIFTSNDYKLIQGYLEKIFKIQIEAIENIL